MRSQLLVPADDDKKLQRALESAADCLWLDLQDLAGAGLRPRAREMALGFLHAARQRPQPPRIFVRVNGLDSGEIEADLDAVMEAAPDGIVLPKSRGGADVQHLGVKLAVREAECGLPDGSTRIIAVAAEMPAALFLMGTYAGASHRLVGLAWSARELAAAIGAKATTKDGALTAPFALARNLTLLAAKGAGVAAIDQAHADRDGAGLKAACEEARRDGFTGKLAIEPEQIATINAVFP